MNNRPALRLNLAPRQWIEFDGQLYRLARRAGDPERRLVFETPEGLSETMTDGQLLDLQQGTERRLRLLSDGEAEERLEPRGRPRATVYTADTEEEEAETLRRYEYVLAWKRDGRPPRTDAGLEACVLGTYEERRTQGTLPLESKPPSTRTVARWIEKWLHYGESVDGLVPQLRASGNRDSKLHPAIVEILSRVVDEEYFIETRPTAVEVHRSVSRAVKEHNASLPEGEKLPIPGINAVHIHIRRTDAYTRDYCRLGGREANLRWRPTGSSPETQRHNEVWEMDHTVVDAIVIDDDTGMPLGRPTVTTAIDRHTRAVPGLPFIGFDPPGIYPTMEFLRGAILPNTEAIVEFKLPQGSMPFMGKPTEIVPDLGADFRSKTYVQGLTKLGIGIEWTPLHKPWYKGKVERFFRHLTGSVFQRVPGTTFSSFFERNKERIPEKVATVTLNELRYIAAHWVAGVYNVRPHRGLMRRSPLGVWQESVARFGMDALPNPQDVRAALSPIIQRTLHHYGVEYEGLIYNSPRVAELRIRPGGARTVYRLHVDPLELTYITVVDPDSGEFIRVPIKESMRAIVTGITLEKHKHAQALRRANGNRLEGEAGLQEAYALIDEAVRRHGAEGGLRNRRKAAAYWDKLSRRMPIGEASMFDTEESADAVTDGMFGEAQREPIPMPVHATVRDTSYDDAATAAPPGAKTEWIAPAHVPPARKRGRPKKEKPDVAAAESPAREQDADGDDDELQAEARRLGMVARRMED